MTGHLDWRHVERMTDDCGLLEHSRGPIPDRRHGYCTDDNGRALGLVSIAGDATLEHLAERYLAFLVHADLGGGHFALRMDYRRDWLADRSDDASGRAIHGLGLAAAFAPWPAIRSAARVRFDEALSFRSIHSRAMAHATLGAAQVATVGGEGDPAVEALFDAALASFGAVPGAPDWPWAEPRLRYANALVPHARLAIGRHRDDPDLIADGLRQLDWLVARQSHDSHLSVVPHVGAGPDERGRGFDQQPIELWHLAEAAALASTITGEAHWSEVVLAARRWFEGHNDLGVVMFDTESGGTFDGLTPSGPNRNQGAESTLARIAVDLAWSRSVEAGRTRTDAGDQAANQ